MKIKSLLLILTTLVASLLTHNSYASGRLLAQPFFLAPGCSWVYIVNTPTITVSNLVCDGQVAASRTVNNGQCSFDAQPNYSVTISNSNTPCWSYQIRQVSSNKVLLLSNNYVRPGCTSFLPTSTGQTLQLFNASCGVGDNYRLIATKSIVQGNCKVSSISPQELRGGSNCNTFEIWGEPPL